MKKLLLFCTCFLALFLQEGLSQTIVSTTPENKNVVLEEFTGIYCVFCPKGHKIAQDLKDAYPGKVVLVNVHTGGYAAPAGSDPDFRTSFGNGLSGQSGLSGYPAGTINRHDFTSQGWDQDGGTAMSRANWDSAATQEFAVGTPVNVAATATWDVLSNEIIVYVEAYYTSNSNTSTNKLNVAILENNVPGPQKGGMAFNPTNFDADCYYLHQHMLRDFATGSWGVDIDTTTSGYFYSNTFTYPIPADYNGIVPDPFEMEVAVYVAEGQQEILTGVQIPLTMSNSTVNNSSLVSVGDLGAYCGYTATPQVTIRNMGTATLTSLDLACNINGGPSSNYQWTGSLDFYEEEVITLPIVAFIPAGTNTINVSTAFPNGHPDDDVFDDSGFNTFTDAPEATSTTVVLELRTDNSADETSWEIKDEAGTVLYSAAQGSLNNGTTYNDTLVFPNSGCYRFTIHDSDGDGLAAGQGYYNLTCNQVIIINGASFRCIEEKLFQVTAGAEPPLVGVTSSSSSTSNTNCDGTATITPSGGTGPYTFLWDDGNTQTTVTAKDLCPGDYYPILYDNAGAVKLLSVTVPYDPPLNIKSTLYLADLEISPNPFAKFTTVSFSLSQTQNVAISVFNLVGEEVAKVGEKAYPPGNYREYLEASSLPAGIYFISVKVAGFANIKKVTHTK